MNVRDARAWIFLVVGLVLATLTGVALYGVSQQMAQRPQGAAAASLPTIDVIVANVDLPARTVITKDVVALKSYPSDLVPVGAVTNEADALGQATIAPISKGQAIVRGQLSAAEGKRAGALTIEKGKVLVAFPTSDPLTVAGLINVGDSVDILASVSVGAGQDARVSQTTVQNLEVLDVLGPTKEQPQRVTSLVFAVDHQVALVLKYLRDAQATVDIAVRSHAESELTKTNSVNLSYLVSTYGIAK